MELAGELSEDDQGATENPAEAKKDLDEIEIPVAMREESAKPVTSNGVVSGQSKYFSNKPTKALKKHGNSEKSEMEIDLTSPIKESKKQGLSIADLGLFRVVDVYFGLVSCSRPQT